MFHASRGNIAVSLLAGIGGAVLVLVFVANSPSLLSRFQGIRPTSILETSSPSDLQLNSNEALVVNTVKKVQPAVVSVIITKDVPIIEQFFDSVPNNSPFGNFFSFPQFEFQAPKLQQRGTERREIGGGSGFLVSVDGLVVTNRHVVADEAAEYTVFTSDGVKHEAKVVARDPSNDVAILKIEGTSLPFLEFGNSDTLQVGQTAIAIGNALSEFRNSVSVGVISGLARSIVAGDSSGQSEQLDQVIQTDAAINPGNSGGPLLSSDGHVIGVNVAVAQGSENIGFALPANIVKDAVESVQKNGKIVRPFLGIRYVQITPIIKEQNKLANEHGVIISRGETATELAIIPGSSADKAGLKEGDIILEADGQKLTESVSLSSIIRTKNVGDTITCKVLSQGAEKTVTVTLQEAPQ